MFQLPKTPHRPTAQNRLPPSPRRKRLRNKHPSRSPPRLRGSKAYRHRAPKLRPAPASFTQDASPTTGPNDSPDVSYEMTNPSSPLDRYNPTRKTAYRQLMIDCASSPIKWPSSSTSGNYGNSERTANDSEPRGKATSAPKRTKFPPPEEVDDGVFFSSDPAPNSVTTPAPRPKKKSARILPPLSFALDTDALDLPSPYCRFQPNSTTDDPPTNPAYPAHPAFPFHRADGPAFAYYIN